MQFSAGPSDTQSGYIHVDFRVLRELLRLPQGVDIEAVRPDPNHAGKCIVDLAGALPVGGELEAEYSYQHTTVVTFRGFKQVT
jgi:hypothetical protein